MALVKELKLRGVDVVDVSSGSGSSMRGLGIAVPKVPGYHVVYTEHIRRETGVATVAVGEITDPAMAEAILKEGKADYIGVARGMLFDPYWAAHAAQALGLPDYLHVMTPNYAIRLEMREEEREKWKPGGQYEVPFRRK